MGIGAVWTSGVIYLYVPFGVSDMQDTWYEGELLGKERTDHALLNFPVDRVDAGSLQLEQHLPLLWRWNRHLDMLGRSSNKSSSED